MNSYSPEYAKVFESEELLSQYVRVYSVQASYGAKAIIGEGDFTNERDLDMGCKFEKNGLNYTKFTRPASYSARFCIDPEAEYKLQGNFENNPTKMIHIHIDRCTPSTT